MLMRSRAGRASAPPAVRAIGFLYTDAARFAQNTIDTFFKCCAVCCSLASYSKQVTV